MTEPYLSLPVDSDEYTQKLYANLIEIKDKIDEDENQMILITHCYEQTGRIPWKVLSTKEKIYFLLNLLIRLSILIVCLYLFIVTLDLMTSAFILLNRSIIGRMFKSRIFLRNPIIGLMFGIIITTIVQSSSTITSMIVSLVGSGLVDDVRTVVPMIMGEKNV